MPKARQWNDRETTGIPGYTIATIIVLGCILPSPLLTYAAALSSLHWMLAVPPQPTHPESELSTYLWEVMMNATHYVSLIGTILITVFLLFMAATRLRRYYINYYRKCLDMY